MFKKLYNKVECVLQLGRGSLWRKSNLRVPHPSNGTSLDIAGYRQNDGYSCGAIAGYIVLKAIHGDVNFREFYEKVAPCPKNGTTDRKLISTLKLFGVITKKSDKRLSWREITRAIDGGFPILTTFNYWSSEDTHWVVLYGYSRSRDIYIANPESRAPHRVSYKKYSELYSGDSGYICWGI